MFPLPHSLEEVFPAQLVSPHALLLPQVFLHHSLEWDQEQASQGALDIDCAVDREREPGQKTHLGSNSCVI